MGLRRVTMVANAHIDPIWLWRWQDGYAEIKATFRAALDRLNEFPELVFSASSATFYRWVEESDPGMFEEIRCRVREGRWVVFGGWWLEPDCNIPCGESFVRQALYGQRYFQEHLGVQARIGGNVDSFGHSGGLPQLLSKSGMDAYVFMRPNESEKHLDTNRFWWEGVDGSRVRAFRICTYATPGGIEMHYDSALAVAGRQDTDLLFFFGIGNHGGGPSIRDLHWIRALREQGGPSAVSMGSAQSFFDGQAYDGEVPAVRGDLQHHATGCYSALSRLKALNRMAENRLVTAEKYAALSAALLGHPYDLQRFAEMWKTLLFHQFHDLLGGCHIRSAYEDALQAFGAVLHESGLVLNAAQQKLSWAVDTTRGRFTRPDKDRDWQLWHCEGSGTPYVVFNPHAWDVEAAVQVNKELKGVTDSDGRAVLSQHVRGEQTNGRDLWNTVFCAKVPAMGYRVYWLHLPQEDEATDGVAPAADTFGAQTEVYATAQGVLENALLRLELDACGGIRRLLDKAQGRELLRAGRSAHAQVIDETHCDTWAHGIWRFDQVIGAFGANAHFAVLENGPLRAVLRATSTYGQSMLRQDFILYHDSARLEIRNWVHWREAHRMLKYALPLALEKPVLTAEIPCGVVDKSTDGREHVGQQWVDMQEADGPAYGVCVLNDAKYAFSADGSTLQLTMLRSPAFADHYGERDELCEYTDQGEHEFRYVLYPHVGDWRVAQAQRRAMELNAPLTGIVETFRAGPLPLQYAGIRMDADSVVVQAFKRAEDEGGYIVRCFETGGISARCCIEIPVLSRKWDADFTPFALRTFYLPDDPERSVIEVLLAEYGQEASAKR